MADAFFSLADLGLQTTQQQYLQQWLTAMQTQWPNYAPSQGSQEYVMAQVIASWAADVGALASIGSASLLQAFGTDLVNLPPLTGQPAVATLNISTAATGIPIAVTSAPLTNGGPIVSIPVNPILYDIPAGTITLVGTPNQTWTTTGATAGATAIPVASQTPSANYPAGSNITGTLAYTVPSGTQFSLDGLGFQTLSSVDIPSGGTATVPVYALETGSDYNGAGAGGQISIISQVNWITGVTLASGSASGGIDPEDDNAYLLRLTNTLTTMAQRPITALDYQTLAMNFIPAPGTDQQLIGRAAAIDGATLPSPQARTVYVYVTDSNGNPLNTDTINALAAWFNSLREVNFIVNVANPAYQPVYVTVTVHASPNYTQAAVASAVQNVVTNWLSPATFGLGRGITGTWATQTVTIYRSQLEAVIQQIQGVDHIVTGTLAFGGAANPTNTTGDYVLPGPATLPVATLSTVNVNFA